MIKISEMFNVSLDYLLKTEEYSTVKPIIKNSDISDIDDEIDDYIKNDQMNSRIIVIAIMMIINSVSFCIYKDSPLSIAMMFVFIALAVFLLICVGMQAERFKTFKEEYVFVDSLYLEQLAVQYQKEHRQNIIKIASGVMLCIVSVVPVILTEQMHEYENIGIIMLFFLVSVGTALFILAGTSESRYHLLLGDIEFVKEKKAKKEMDSIYGIVFPLTSMVYLILGFVFHLWHPGWVIFPISLFLCLGYTQLKRR
ncbi:MAG: hypothetical protein ACLSSU_06025 [Beduini sp.]